MSKEVVLIDRDELLKHEVMIITKGNAAFHGVPSSLIEIAPVIGLKSLWPVWRDPETDPPKVEEEVLIMYQTASGGCGITTAHYEDGTILSQDSIFCWDELAAWGELDEEHDDYIIPKGWWEYRHRAGAEAYPHWRPLLGDGRRVQERGHGPGRVRGVSRRQVGAGRKRAERKVELMDKEQLAIARLQDAARLSEHRYKKPLMVTYSGGKDSQVLVALAERAGINFEVVNSHTTADAPETVYFIREQFKAMEERGIKCSIFMPRYKDKPVSMWTLIPQKLMPPTRLVRYCCNVLKENTGKNRFIATGVRWEESARRKNSRGVMELMHKDPAKRIILMGDNDEKRKLFETCNLKGKMTVNPIVDWSDDDVWDYMHSEHLPVNPLYFEGQKRVGCIGCPMAGRGGRQREFMRWPAYEKMYISAFERMLDVRKAKGLPCDWQTGMDVFRWWMEDDNISGQLSMDDLMGVIV